MLEKGGAAGASETPWGLTWADLLKSLRPVRAENERFDGIVRQIRDALNFGGVEHDRVVAGSAYGKQTMVRGDRKLDVFVVFETSFDPARYLDAHLKPVFDALVQSKGSPFVDVEDKGLAVHFIVDDVECRVFAAGVLNGGPKDLLLPAPSVLPPSSSSTSLMSDPSGSSSAIEFAPNGYGKGGASYITADERAVHIETTCALHRIDLIRLQCPLFKDMARVAKKWRSSCNFMRRSDAPGDYLIELLMLEAYHGAAHAVPSPDLYAAIFRRFLALVSSQSGTGSDVLAAADMPKSFLSWTTFYNQGAIDHCIAKGLLKLDNSRSELCSLVVVDPAVPFVNVAETVKDWGEIRKLARESLSHFQNTEIVEVLQTRLQTFSTGVEETLKSMQTRLDTLQWLEESPRRWSGVVQFKDPHMSGDAWAIVMEVELRRLKWRLNARCARSEGVGYNSVIDVSLQLMSKPLTRSIDVDVNFRNTTSQLVFDPNTDHVLVARRSEVIRNRDYNVQITIVA